MWCGVFFFAVLVIPVSRLRGGFCAVCARGVGVLFAFVCVEIDWQSVTLRYKLPDDSLQDALAVARSKSHSALTRPLGSRFTEVSVPNSMLVSSYVLSTRV